MKRTIDDAVKSGMGDWTIERIVWKDNATFQIVFYDTSGHLVDAVFYGIRRFKAEMDFEGFVGLPLIFSAANERIASDFSFALEFGGQPDGQLSFLYERAEVEA